MILVHSKVWLLLVQAGDCAANLMPRSRSDRMRNGGDFTTFGFCSRGAFLDPSSCGDLRERERFSLLVCDLRGRRRGGDGSPCSAGRLALVRVRAVFGCGERPCEAGGERVRPRDAEAPCARARQYDCPSWYDALCQSQCPGMSHNGQTKKKKCAHTYVVTYVRPLKSVPGCGARRL